MEEKKGLSPEATKKLVMAATIELVIEVGLVILLLFVLRWEMDLTTLFIIIAPAMAGSLYVAFLVLNDEKQDPANASQKMQ